MYTNINFETDVVTGVGRHDSERRDVCEDDVPAQRQGTRHYPGMLSRWKIRCRGEHWTQGFLTCCWTVAILPRTNTLSL